MSRSVIRPQDLVLLAQQGEYADQTQYTHSAPTMSNIKAGVNHAEAKKDGSGTKPHLALIPPVASEQEALAFMVGQRKYGLHNYKAGGEVVSALNLIAAARRHIDKYLDGEDYDWDEKAQLRSHHLGNARACLAMILEQERLGTLVDDRYSSTTDQAGD